MGDGPLPADMDTWGELFERAEQHPTTTAAVRETLAERRERRARDGEYGDDDGSAGDGEPPGEDRR